MWFVWFVCLDWLVDVGGIGFVVVGIGVLFGELEIGWIKNCCWNFEINGFIVLLEGGWIFLWKWIGIICIVLVLLIVIRVFCILEGLGGVLFGVWLVLLVVLFLGWFGWVDLFILLGVVLFWGVIKWFVCFKNCCRVELVLLVGMWISFLCENCFGVELREEEGIVIRVLGLFVWICMWIFLEILGILGDGFNVLGGDGRVVLMVNLFVVCGGKVCKRWIS